MTTESEDILNRYKQLFDAEDTRGRVFKIRRLKLSQQSRIIEFTENPLNRFNYSVVASVQSLTNEQGQSLPFGFPETLEKLFQTMDLLGEEGFKACAEKYAEINGLTKQAPGEEQDDADAGTA